MFKLINENNVELEDEYLQMKTFKELKKLYPTTFNKYCVWLYYMYSPFSMFFSNFADLKERLIRVNYELDLDKTFDLTKLHSKLCSEIIQYLQPNIIKELEQQRQNLKKYITDLEEIDILERDDFKKYIVNPKQILEIRKDLPQIIVNMETTLSEQVSKLSTKTKIRKQQELNEFNS